MGANDHIPTEEIHKDIADTEAEIVTMEREEKGLRLIGTRLTVFQADARRDGICRRKEFVTKLQALLAERQ